MPTQNKTKKLRVFKNLDKKLVSQKGVQYSFEKVDVVSNIPNLKGDIVKKYVNGKLKEQKFVTREKLSKLVESASKKEHKHIIGGKATQKVLKKPKIANVQLKSNTLQLLEEQKKKELELAERQVVAQENMVKAADTANNLDKGLLGLIGIAVGVELFNN